MDGPTNRSAQRFQTPSSTRLPSTSTRVQSNDSAACATIRFNATDLPAPGSPPMSRLRSASTTFTGAPASSRPRNTGSKMDSDPSTTPLLPLSLTGLHLLVDSVLAGVAGRAGRAGLSVLLEVGGDRCRD